MKNLSTPVDINSWHAGIANRKYSHLVRVKQHVKGRLLDYAFLILHLYFYVYLFIAVTLITGPQIWPIVSPRTFSKIMFYCKRYKLTVFSSVLQIIRNLVNEKSLHAGRY